MKIVSLIAGAGDMYCGSCLRDNNLAAALKRQGHDVILAPLYTPVRTDEADQTTGHVFFGGISVYLEQMSFLFRRTPKFLDALWDSPAVIRAFTGRGVQVEPKALGDLAVSILRGARGHQGKEIAHLTEWLRHEARPDVVTLPYTLLIALAGPMKAATGAPVVCTLQGEELFLEGLLEPWRSEALTLIRQQVDQVDAFIAVSDYERLFMSGYLGIPESKIHVVPLGINPQGHSLERRSKPAGFHIGYFARIAPEKGLHLLVSACEILKKRDLPPWSLLTAGYLPPENRAYLEQQQRRLPFQYSGAPDRAGKIRFLQNLDVMALPCTFDEPKGLPALEAMANGVPVLAPRRGAFPRMIEATGGGLLFEPDSAESLAEAILRVWQDPSLALQLGRAGYTAVHRDWTLDQMAERTAAVFREAVERASTASLPDPPAGSA